MGVNHYENFPVASRLCPAAIRPAVVAIYRFARTADDIADEGSAPASERLADLSRYREALLRCAEGNAAFDAAGDATLWPEVFGPLAHAIRQHRLPLLPLTQLLDAFTEDARHAPYPDRAALLRYCERSANPVGRLMLHLYGIDDEASRQQSDAICTALQLINFWQDFSRDHPRGRCYLPVEDVQRHGLDLRLTPAIGLTDPDGTKAQALVRDLVDWAEGLMLAGAPLALRVPGRSGWELRLVVAGGLRIVAKIRAMEHRCLHRRPRLRAWDLPALLWQAGRLSATLRRHGKARPTAGEAANRPSAG